MKGWKEREMGRDGSERKTALRGNLRLAVEGVGEGFFRQTALGILVSLACSLALNAI